MIWWSDATFYQFASIHAFFGLPDLMPIGHFINGNAAFISKWSVSHFVVPLDMSLYSSIGYEVDRPKQRLSWLSCELSFPCFLASTLESKIYMLVEIHILLLKVLSPCNCVP